MQIKDNVFVVTGGASGLGAATARMIVDGGGKVVLVDVNQQAGTAMETELGSHARFVQTDVTSDESARNAFAVAQSMGQLRGLVNCAGVAPAEKVVGKEGAHKLDSFARTININLVGSFNMIRLAAEIMGARTRRRRRTRRDRQHRLGGGLRRPARPGGYAASKGGVVAMTLPIARELAQPASA
jgi:NAD(P)-dependent dehydrogenase (short-subunit alcohol dehydrogenase family)